MGSTNNYFGSPLPGQPRPHGVSSTGGRLRNYTQFVAAVIFFFLARSVASHAVRGLATEVWRPLLEQLVLLLLLAVGYSAMGLTFQRQLHPIDEQGFPRRKGWSRELGQGVALGWGVAVVCVLPMMLVGGIAISISGRLAMWGWLLADVLFFLALTLVEEIAFRGFGFQCLLQAAGPMGATLVYSLFYAILQMSVFGSTGASFAASFLLALLLTTAYRRTRALWIGWGINFAWKASRAIVFGLIVNGLGSHSSVVESTPMGPSALTGGYFGLDGTWVACLILLAAIPVLVRMTRDLDFEHNAPVIVPGGYPVDIDARARAQHESAMGPAIQPLVQIFPAAPAVAEAPAAEAAPADPPAQTAS